MVTKNIAANEQFQPNVENFGLRVLSTPATLSYSVDGETWTDYEDEIADENNVIANSAVGMYFKVSVDAVITLK